MSDLETRYSPFTRYLLSASARMLCSALCFKILSLPANSVFENLSKKEYMEVRSCIIKSILSTDMANHFEFHAKFQAKLANKKPDAEFAFDKNDAKDRLEVLKMLIKCGDIGNAAAPFDVSQEWNRRANLEFYKQGDIIRRGGDQPPPFLDRTKIMPEQNSLNFLDFIARPLFNTLAEFLPLCKVYATSLDNNRTLLGQEVKAKSPWPPVNGAEGAPSMKEPAESFYTQYADTDAKKMTWHNIPESMKPFLVNGVTPESLHISPISLQYLPIHNTP